MPLLARGVIMVTTGSPPITRVCAASDLPDRRAGAVVDHDQHRLAGLDRHILRDDPVRRSGDLDGNRHLENLLFREFGFCGPPCGP